MKLHNSAIAGSIRTLLLGPKQSLANASSFMSTSRAQSAGSGTKLAVGSVLLLEILKLTSVLNVDLQSGTFFGEFLSRRSKLYDLKASWEMQADDGSWDPHSRSICKLLEQQHVNGHRIGVTIHGVPHLVNFNEMTQTNRLTKSSTRIRRIAPPANAAVPLSAAQGAAFSAARALRS